MEEKEISIQEIFGIVLGHIKLIIILTLLAGAAAYSYARFVMPEQYTSSIKIYVTNGRNTGDNGTGALTAQDQQAARSLANTYIVILDDASVYEAISDRLIEDFKMEDLKKFFTTRIDDEGKEYIPNAQIKKLINISAVNNTEVLQVVVTSEVPKFSAKICEYISDLAPELIKRTTKAGSVETVSPPKVPIGPSGPNVKRYALLGLIAGFAIAVGLSVLLNFFDNTVKGGEDIKDRFGIPVLAEIPDIFMDEKGGNKYAR
ncbi:MAG: lipopolysaccharide biosynthesis protein [Ruminococcus sp.]|nr:lipopolysaccharide biosynthesis protein [Ruminococcus sp.]MBQ1433370.1 lipopolysaccharide biosynthesis protein [Ruminococcus sp.]